MQLQSTIGQRTQELDNLVSEMEGKNLNERLAVGAGNLNGKFVDTQLKRKQASYL